MRNSPTPLMEKFRLTKGQFVTSKSDGCNGYFVATTPWNTQLAIIASDGMGWEHASIHVVEQKRLPGWSEMQWIKEQFWEDEETVVQFHPRKSKYTNDHIGTLHLWRMKECEWMLPPRILV